jgi:hypothetical protein
MPMASAGPGLRPTSVCVLLCKMDLRAGLAPAYAVYETAASLPMLAERLQKLKRPGGVASGPLDLLV